MLNFNDIAVFTRVVEANSFTGGAQQLNMPKATVSRKIADLENRLGVRLLERTTRKLRLTEAGREFYLRCNESIASLEAAQQRVTDTQASPQGRLRITCPTLGQRMVCEPINEFLRQYPKIDIDIVFTDDLLDLIEGGYDLAIRGGQLSDSSLIARKLGPTRPVICASPHYLRRHGTPVRPADLRAHDCLVLSTSLQSIRWTFRGPDGSETVCVSGRLKSNDANFILEAVMAGLGIARLPSFTVSESLRDGRLQALLGEYTPHFGDIYLVYPSRRHLPTRVRVFIEFLEAKMKPQPLWLLDQA